MYKLASAVLLSLSTTLFGAVSAQSPKRVAFQLDVKGDFRVAYLHPLNKNQTLRVSVGKTRKTDEVNNQSSFSVSEMGVYQFASQSKSKNIELAIGLERKRNISSRMYIYHGAELSFDFYKSELRSALFNSNSFLQRYVMENKSTYTGIIAYPLGGGIALFKNVDLGVAIAPGVKYVKSSTDSNLYQYAESGSETMEQTQYTNRRISPDVLPYFKTNFRIIYQLN